MFDAIGRRLALLNGATVLLVTALVCASTFVALRTSLMRESDHALRERIQAAELSWRDLFATATSPIAPPPPPEAEDDDGGRGSDAEEQDGDDEGHELVESGDTLVFAFNAAGAQIADSRGVPIAGLPSTGSVQAALRGHEDRRTVHLDDESVRVISRPVLANGEVIGVVQAARSQAEHESELSLVLTASIVGIALGALIAVPSGLFLSRRAMRPIGVAFDRQRAFVADASHELRTPLAVIRANAELVQRLPDASEEVKTEIGFMLTEVDGMTRLVDDLLLLARLDDSSLLLEREACDLGEIAAGVVSAMDAVAISGGLTLRLEAAGPVSGCVDPGRLRQVLRILVHNACKHTPPGGEIVVGLEQLGSRAAITVADTGVGIAPEDRERVFLRFQRVHADRSRDSGGAGLGLTIAKALVEAHTGTIEIVDGAATGATFRIVLPAQC